VLFLLTTVVFVAMLFPYSGETFGFVSEFANRTVGGFFSAIPFSLLTVAILVVPALVALVIWRIVVNKKNNTLKRFWMRATAFVCVCYIWCSCIIGFNYRKESVYVKMGLADVTVDTEAIVSASTCMINLLNDCSTQVEFDGMNRNLVLPDGYDRQHIKKLVKEAVAKQNFDFLYDFDATPKDTFVPGVLKWSGADGIYFPLFAELNIDSSVVDGNLAVLLTHETIHSKGILDEEETEFLAQYICVFSDDPVLKYSGSYTATIYLLREVMLADENLFFTQLNKINDEPLRKRIGYFTQKSINDKEFFESVSSFFYDIYLRLNFVDGADAYYKSINGWVRFFATPALCI